jgi:hypothetical protein
LAPAAGPFIRGDNVYDLSRLSDEEFGLLEKLLKKASGELEGEIITPSFKIEFVERGQIMIESNADDDALAK